MAMSTQPTTQKTNFDTCAKKHSKETQILLNFVNLSSIFCPRLYRLLDCNPRTRFFPDIRFVQKVRKPLILLYSSKKGRSEWVMSKWTVKTQTLTTFFWCHFWDFWGFPDLPIFFPKIEFCHISCFMFVSLKGKRSEKIMIWDFASPTGAQTANGPIHKTLPLARVCKNVENGIEHADSAYGVCSSLLIIRFIFIRLSAKQTSYKVWWLQNAEKALRKKCPYLELFWSVFFPHFPVFGLNAERYSHSVQIRENAGKMWTRITPNTDTFYAVKWGIDFKWDRLL